MTDGVTPQQQIESLKQQLCEAFIARQDADEKIKAIRNVLAGIPIGQAMAVAAAGPPAAD